MKEDYDDLKKRLKGDFFLISRNSVWGGLIASLVILSSVGFLTYDKIESKVDEAWLNKINQNGIKILNVKSDSILSQKIPQIISEEINIGLDKFPVGSIIYSVLNPKVFLNLVNVKNSWVELNGCDLNPEWTLTKLLYENSINLPDGKVPNVKGNFLRAMGEKNRKVGTFQEFATALPKDFKIDIEKAGKHKHNHRFTPNSAPHNKGGSSHYRSAPETQSETSSNGEHTHSVNISGGDLETRPDNIAFYVYMKVN